MAFARKALSRLLPTEVNITLIRHAQNKGDELLPEGWKNARHVGSLMREEADLGGLKSTKFYSSPAKRAMQTTVALMDGFHYGVWGALSNKPLEMLDSKELAQKLSGFKANKARVLQQLRPFDRKDQELFDAKLKELGADRFCREWLRGDQKLLESAESPKEVVERLKTRVLDFPKRISRALPRSTLKRLFARKPINLVMVTHGPLPEALIEQLTGRPINSFKGGGIEEGKIFSNLEHVTLKIKGSKASLHFRGEQIPVKL
jgi:broad specificity phosphatase PhoE